MNLWVVGWSAGGGLDPAGAARALRGVTAEAGFLDPEAIESWRSPAGRVVAAWVGHGPERVGGVRYVVAEEGRFAAFAGRPVVWTGGERADGRAPLDPAWWLGPGWDGELDGRWIAARASDEALEVACDALGAYGLFRAEAGGVTWFSGNPEALARVVGESEGGAGMSRGGWDADSLSGLLAGGWPLTGEPWWRGVRRVPHGSVVTLRVDGGEAVRRRLPEREVVSMLGAEFDAPRTARVLVESLRALSDWPGRPSLVPVTAGRDSRLILAAALHLEGEWEAVTAGVPGMVDVEGARALCAAAGVPHRVLDFDPHGNRFERPRRLAQVVALTTAGTASAADGAGFPLGRLEGPLPLWHSGQGGEVARGYYGSGAGLDRDGLVEHLHRRFTTRRPGRPGVVGEEGDGRVRAQLARFVDEQLGLGAAPADVPDLFYLHQRMGHWAGPTHACVEWVRDTTSPLWSVRLVGAQLGLPVGRRHLEHFHREVLRELAPRLVEVPFEGGEGWPGERGAVRRRVGRARTLARKAVAEAWRRRPRRRVAAAPVASGAPASPPPEDPWARVVAAVREAAAGAPAHPVWAVLDRQRVEALLARDPASLDEMSRTYVWRLATVFLSLGGD